MTSNSKSLTYLSFFIIILLILILQVYCTDYDDFVEIKEGPALLHPNPDTEIPINKDYVTLSWKTVKGANTYNVYIDNIKVGNVPDTQFTVERKDYDLEEHTWTIIAENEYQYYPSPIKWKFIFINEKPTLIDLKEDDVICQTETIDFNWTMDPAPISYIIEIFSDSQTKNLIDNYPLSVDTNNHKVQLDQGEYWWRVKAVYENYESDFSELRHFTVAYSPKNPEDEKPVITVNDKISCSITDSITASCTNCKEWVSGPTLTATGTGKHKLTFTAVNYDDAGCFKQTTSKTVTLLIEGPEDPEISFSYAKYCGYTRVTPTCTNCGTDTVTIDPPSYDVTVNMGSTTNFTVKRTNSNNCTNEKTFKADNVKVLNNPFSGNLITNPGCETGSVSGWTVVSGGWSCTTSSSRVYEGSYGFYPGTVTSGELYQEIDLSAGIELIDTGNLSFAFETYMKSDHSGSCNADKPRIIIEYLDETKTSILNSFDSGWIGLACAWGAENYEVIAPAGTRHVRIRMLANRGAGTELNAYFDNLSLYPSCAP